MTADPPTPPTQDKLAEIEQERLDDGYEYDVAVAAVDWLIDEVKRLRGLGNAVQRVLDDLDQAGFVSREGQEGLRQAMRTAWLDLP